MMRAGAMSCRLDGAAGAQPKTLMPMREGSLLQLAIATPVVNMIVGVAAEWEKTGTIADIALIAEHADRLGYHHLTCSEHVGVPAAEVPRRGGRYWDPLATFGYIAARTTQIRLATSVLVLGYHHPLEIVKRYGTLDQVSGGRLVLGVGVGSLKEEFELLGAAFDDRGPRADDAIKALRVSLSTSDSAYDGQYYTFSGLTVDPCARQHHVPIWVGGRTLRSLRRAVALADGWCPFGIPLDTVPRWLEKARTPPGFEVVLPPEHPIDPLGQPTKTMDTLAAIAAGGATIFAARFIHHSLRHYLEQLEALTELHRDMASDSAAPNTTWAPASDSREVNS
jgi:probable F420-dependent oxidoreductase